jgi:hypothetical protein
VASPDASAIASKREKSERAVATMAHLPGIRSWGRGQINFYFGTPSLRGPHAWYSWGRLASICPDDYGVSRLFMISAYGDLTYEDSVRAVSRDRGQSNGLS